jgi:hypothetical protein
MARRSQGLDQGGGKGGGGGPGTLINLGIIANYTPVAAPAADPDADVIDV